MIQDDAGRVKLCPECGAENIPQAAVCWMCRGDLKQIAAVELITAEAVPNTPKFAPSAAFFPVLTLVAIAVAVLVGWALGEQSLGFLPFYAIIVIPALIASSIRVGRKRLRGQPVSWGEAILTGLISVAIIHATLGLLMVAGIVALFAMCAFSASGLGR